MASVASSPLLPQPHMVLFPFMAKGHTIPLLHLARRLLLRHGTAVTVVTTPANQPFVSHFLAGTAASVVSIPFPPDPTGQVPAGVESTDKLPSLSLLAPFANATKLMRADLDAALSRMSPRVTALVSDGFLGWTLQSSNLLRVPRYVYYGMGNYAMSMSCDVAAAGLLLDPRYSDDEPFVVPSFPRIELTKNDWEPSFRSTEGVHHDFMMEQVLATAQSHGIVVNSFAELETEFLDYWNSKVGPKAWCVGPLCLVDPPSPVWPTHEKPWYLRWLDQKQAQGKPVLYVAFGSQAEVSPEQMAEFSAGLEESGVEFLWATRKGWDVDGMGRSKRGLVVRDWVEQREVLGHGGVWGFMSHCGWNSVLESISAGVPVAACPLQADQHLNARMVVEELEVGVRVGTRGGSVRGFVGREGVAAAVRELMEGEMGKEARKKVRELAAAARRAVEEGGSSRRTLDMLLDDACIGIVGTTNGEKNH